MKHPAKSVFFQNQNKLQHLFMKTLLITPTVPQLTMLAPS